MKFFIRTLLIILINLFSIFPVVAEEMPVPPKLQTVLFLKILSYDRVIKSDIKIGVLYSSNTKSISVKNEIVSSFKSLSEQKIGDVHFSVTEVSLGELSSLRSKDISVLYITPENKSNMEMITKAARSAGIMTITGVPSYVEDSFISVGIGVKENKKPEIIVNLSSSKAEGRDFSAQLLKLAKVIK